MPRYLTYSTGAVGTVSGRISTAVKIPNGIYRCSGTWRRYRRRIVFRKSQRYIKQQADLSRDKARYLLGSTS